MAKVNPYLNFNGNTEEAFNFYKTVFGGEFTMIQKFKDTPHGDNMSATDKEKVMHVALPITKDTTLMATDMLESMGQQHTPGNNFSLAIAPDSKEEGEKFFNALAEGGRIEMPFEKAFWGAWFGALTDKFGIQWMVNFDEKPAD